MRSYIDLNKLLENFGIQRVNNNLNVFREKYKIYFLPESFLQLIYFFNRFKVHSSVKSNDLKSCNGFTKNKYGLN